jgi:lysophospholipid acyltransferase (LPLAT)-like uncharacterized protein
MKTFRKLWKGFWTPILRLPLVQWLVAAVMSVVIWTVYFTSWRKIEGAQYFKQYRKRAAIFVFWHGRSMMLSPIVRMYGVRGYAVASRSKDGRMMARLQRIFGLKPIYGSTSEGGVSVLRQGVRILRKNNASVCMSPDGPSGPSLRIQEGALYFAKMSGAPIIPACFSANHHWIQNRWDRYFVALPFSKIKCNIGKPIFIDPKISRADFDTLRAKIEKQMIDQMRRLDASSNVRPIEQDQTATEFKRALREAKKKK